MRLTRRTMFAGVAATAIATTAACSTPTKKDPSASGSASGSAGSGGATGALTVLWNQFFYTYNGSTSFGNNVTNANVIYATNSGPWYYNDKLERVNDTSFCTYEKVSDSPLTIKQTIADTAMWSDGTPVTAADFILAYGAQCGLYNNLTEDESAKLANDDGTIKETADGKVYFDASSEAWKLITEFPEISADGKTITYKYSKVYADWVYALFSTGLPAHVVGKVALGTADPKAAAQAVLDAFKNKDNTALSKIANTWNSKFNFTAMPSDTSLVVGNGPYTITDIQDKKSLTMTANPNYKGVNQPKIKTITIIYNEEPKAAAQALQNGEVAIIEPQASADLLKSLQGNDKITVLSGNQATYEHIDLTFNNGGPFDPKTYGGDAAKALKVRQAFLLCIPRQKIVDNLIKPLNPQAEVRNSFAVTPGTTNYESTVSTNGMATAFPPAGDPAKAKQLLAEAGAKDVKVRFLYSKTNVRRQQEFQLIKESAAQAGITVVDNGDEKWSEKLGGGTYDAALFAWAANNDSLSGSAPNYVTKGQNNFGHYSNKVVDDAYAELQASTDEAKKSELNAKAEKQMVDDAFGTVIFQFPDLTAFDNTKVKNVSVIPFVPSYYWNIWQWELKA